MDNQKEIKQAFWQGLVKLVILHRAGLAPLYGGKLSKYLHNQGYGISPGSLYPALHSLENMNFLRSYIKIFKGRARKYYELTPQGRACLETLRQELGEIVREVLLDDSPGEGIHQAPTNNRVFS